MTLIYAGIADRIVADESAAVSAKIDALYGQQRPLTLPADYETTCAYFRTSVEILPILTRQRDHAHDTGQTELFDGLIDRVETQPASTKQS